ncbi:hypothetical protein XA68_15142 [Ophiocordyceps unilateralis]|uniref:C2H2-type domain-containing protein n=1 Tax=Ophiocordyceps unilateralis TaxID=268505 RepID=A0A2A9P8Q3_OPHUN|nr:hypothetical protein XA68_15142 [Ophiocordyceps unilateralis]
MASTFTLAPAALGNQESGVRRFNTPGFPSQRLSVSVPDAAASAFHSAPASPMNGQLRTPLTGSTLGLNYYHQSSEFGDVDGDPFFGAQFTQARPGSPLFLDERMANKLAMATKHHAAAVYGPSCPPTPARTASISVHNVSPRSERRGTLTRLTACPFPDSVSPEQLQTPVHTVHAVDPADLSPESILSNRTSHDSLAPAPVAVMPQSPRVTVSVWDNHGCAEDAAVPDNCRFGGLLLPADLISPIPSSGFVIGAPEAQASQLDDPVAPRAGLDPDSRPADEVPSINEVVAQRHIEERNEDVNDWLAQHLDNYSAPLETSAQTIQAMEQSGPEYDDGIPLGDQTENRYVAGQTYYNEAGGGFLSQVDREIIAADAKWDDAPMLPHIVTGSCCASQPQTSQAAIDKYTGLCRDNDSILSRSATWGTRRRSHPSVLDLDLDNSRSGSFLKKLAARGRGNGDKTGGKTGSLLKDLRGLVRRPSASSLRRRSRSRSRGPTDDEDSPPPPGGEQQGSPSRLSPSSQPPTWRKRKQKPTPSINTALASVAHSIVNIGTPLPQSGSFCITPPMPSPRTGRASTFGVRSSFARSRSRSDMPGPQLTPARVESHNSLVDLWRRSTGPLLTPLSRTGHFGGGADDDDDDDDDDDHLCEDSRAMNSSFIDSIPPTFEGFQQHILTLYPGLGEQHGYLVDRIAQQQVARYKNLLSARVKHLGLGMGCPNGSLCVTLGGSSSVTDSVAPAAGGEDGVAAEGVIGPDSFPQDIPLPPAPRLPAEFECQLCFQRKRFGKPSDWTKHVHEDVQPFTCTWDKCRDPKVFKRKADWVRHENEGHRHLEWWTCDVDDCRHTCYRRDNFLQHLVREHKFPEPKVKTKAAMKRIGGLDPTWQAVEKCHVETSVRPQDEPCRFCGKSLPSWKKLTVHLAKHMEHISLPVLRLATARSHELSADSVISPVPELANRSVMAPGPALFSAMPPQPPFTPRPNVTDFASGQQSPFGYPVMASEESAPPTPAPFYAPRVDGHGPTLPSINHGYVASSTMPTLQGSPPALYKTSPLGESQLFPQLNVMDVTREDERPTMGQMGYGHMMCPSRVSGGQFSGPEPLPSVIPRTMIKAEAPMSWEPPQSAGFSDHGRLTSASFF